MKGCFLKGWCPEENIFTPETTRLTYEGYTGLVISSAAKIEEQGLIADNYGKTVEYPGYHANSFSVRGGVMQVENMLAFTALSPKAADNLGAMYRIDTKFECSDSPWKAMSNLRLKQAAITIRVSTRSATMAKLLATV